MRFFAIVVFSFTAWLQARSAVCDVVAHGAKGDGRTLDTAAIQRAIDSCSATGGGVVEFPNGRFLSGTIELKSHIALRLSPGATLLGSSKIEDYTRPHLIYARNVENIAIEGGGYIDGNGRSFWDANFKALAKRPSPQIEVVESKDVRIENVHIRNTPGWGIHPLLCDRVLVRGVTIINDSRGPNTDGIDPDSTRNMIISDVYIDTGDDAIVLKTTGRLGTPTPPTENIVINNCVLLSDDAAIKLGTESHGDFRHISVSNCVIRKSAEGIAIYAKDGATIEDINFSRLTIETASIDKRRTYPVFIDLDKRNENSRQGRIRDVTFSDLTVLTKGRILLSGLAGQPLENVVFRNLAIRLTGYESLEGAYAPGGAASVRVRKPQNLGPAPAAFAAEHIDGLTLDGIRIRWNPSDNPPARDSLQITVSNHVQIRALDTTGPTTFRDVSNLKQEASPPR